MGERAVHSKNKRSDGVMMQKKVPGEATFTTTRGTVFDENDLTLLALMHRSGTVVYREESVRLESGITSNIYVKAREDITQNTQLLSMVGSKLANTVRIHSLYTDKQACLVGLPTAGTPLAVAAAVMSYQEKIFACGQYICARQMRALRKTSHGAHQSWVDGVMQPDLQTLWLVDNVTTKGSTKIQSLQKLWEDGYEGFPPCLIFVDREQGGVENLHEVGFSRVAVAFRLLDITEAFVHLGLWPSRVADIVADEIHQHQKV